MLYVDAIWGWIAHSLVLLSQDRSGGLNEFELMQCANVIEFIRKVRGSKMNKTTRLTMRKE
jgi:hypothetical protein